MPISGVLIQPSHLNFLILLEADGDVGGITNLASLLYTAFGTLPHSTRSGRTLYFGGSVAEKSSGRTKPRDGTGDQRLHLSIQIRTLTSLNHMYLMKKIPEIVHLLS